MSASRRAGRAPAGHPGHAHALNGIRLRIFRRVVGSLKVSRRSAKMPWPTRGSAGRCCAGCCTRSGGVWLCGRDRHPDDIFWLTTGRGAAGRHRPEQRAAGDKLPGTSSSAAPPGNASGRLHRQWPCQSKAGPASWELTSRACCRRAPISRRAVS